MTSEAQIDSFQKANPEVTLLTPTSPEWKNRRATRGHAGQEKKPLGIAIPTNAQQVAGIVRWAVKNEVDFTVRTGGNDFYGRNAADGALIIDMRDINFINVADDKTTATIGGGVIAKDMLLKFDEYNLTAPLGNSLEVGYVGWSTIGGYGPFTGALGMGFEGIVGAEVVNHEGEIVKATDEMLEGLRGMGGNLGIVTSLTIKVYPKREVSSHAFVIFVPAIVLTRCRSSLEC
jgi:FAD/FMN-containing dehydrogenase